MSNKAEAVICEKVKPFGGNMECRQLGKIKELEAALSLAEALLQYEREKNLRAEKSLGEARKLTVGGREW